MSSASTWAAPRPTSPISPAPTSGPASGRSPACGCARRCSRSTPSPPAAARSAPMTGSRFRVGPDSAGAVPGPACYRRGGPLTVTDCNVVLGKIRPEHFPHVFGPAATSRSTPRPRSRAAPRSRAQAGMARARRRRRASSASRSTIWPMRSSRSRSPAATTSPATPCNASAAPAASMPAWSPTRSASSRVMIHPLAGVLSAYGMGLADMVELRQRTLAGARSGGGAGRARGAKRRPRCAAQGVEAPEIRRRAALRYDGSDTALEVAGLGRHARGISSRRTAPASASSRRDAPVVIETAIVEAVGKSERSSPARGGGPAQRGGGAPASDSPSTGASAGPPPRRRGGSRTTAPTLSPGDRHPRPRPDRRSLRHHRRRARLAGRGRPARQPHPHPRRAARQRAPRSAPRSIRSCSR